MLEKYNEEECLSQNTNATTLNEEAKSLSGKIEELLSVLVEKAKSVQQSKEGAKEDFEKLISEATIIKSNLDELFKYFNMTF